MAKAKVVSDRLAKVKCREWLEKIGFSDIKPARSQSCDLIARKSSQTYYIEIKYSSKEEGGFFGTVMLTEMFQAICNKENYLFLVCRGKNDDINDWFFKLFNVEDFIKCCTLTTPIFLYHLDAKDRFNLTVPNFSKNTILASERLIKQMWKDFKKWKSKPYLSKGGKYL
jgi:hypothetical protein